MTLIYAIFKQTLPACLILFMFIATLSSCVKTSDRLDSLNNEDNILVRIEKYLDEDERHSNMKQRMLEEVEKTQLRNNPLWRFKEISGLMTELWIYNQQGSEDFQHSEENTNIKTKLENLEKDLEDTARTLFHVQDVYNLSPRHVQNIYHTSEGQVLNVNEYYSLGILAHRQEAWTQARAWLSAALRLKTCSGENGNQEIARVKILEYLAWSEFELKNSLASLRYALELLELDPNSKVKNNMEQLIREIRFSNQTRSDHKTSKSTRDKYKPLCRQVLEPNPSLQSTLRCHMWSNHPSLKFNPAHVEQVSGHPGIVIFHDVLTDREMEIIKSMAIPKFQQATIATAGRSHVGKGRKSKSAWLFEHSEFLQRLEKRVEVLTGLNTEYSEPLQVAYYEIGGHYAPHYDFSEGPESDILRLGNGDRIATLLFYLSDVSLGGRTVFIDKSLSVHPKRYLYSDEGLTSETSGSAVFWYNLKKTGAKDVRTLHAACPVIKGSKWVANMWFHERGQELKKPSGVTELLNEQV